MRPPPQALTRAELRALLEATIGRDRLLLEALACLHLRVRELTTLQITDLDWGRAVAWIYPGREVPIPSALAARLRLWIGERVTGTVFPGCRGELSSRTAQRIVKRAARAAGLPGAWEPYRYCPRRLRWVLPGAGAQTNLHHLAQEEE